MIQSRGLKAEERRNGKLCEAARQDPLVQTAGAGSALADESTSSPPELHRPTARNCDVNSYESLQAFIRLKASLLCRPPGGAFDVTVYGLMDNSLSISSFARVRKSTWENLPGWNDIYDVTFPVPQPTCQAKARKVTLLEKGHTDSCYRFWSYLMRKAVDGIQIHSLSELEAFRSLSTCKDVPVAVWEDHATRGPILVNKSTSKTLDGCSPHGWWNSDVINIIA
ncbi:hypothetical protein Bbelb_217440 [Branchiostoma belcheri]|nr:hypothetical protein Bbelb_217440 [Branchiostoma belcheri]